MSRRAFHVSLFAATGLLAALALVGVAPADESARLGPPPTAPNPPPGTVAPNAAPKLAAPAPRAGGWLDTSNREAVRQSYLNTFVPAGQVPLEWTGSIASGNAGDTSAAYKNAVITAVNWFRSMAGVPPQVTLNATFSSKAQQAALMFSANRNLSHNPPSSWTYWTPQAYEAAGNSNICYNYSDTDFPPGCTVPYMRDDGSNNYAVGHRRWILYPQTQSMGTGDVARTAFDYPYANALWVLDDNFGAPRPPTRDTFVAWPPPGYVPYQHIWLRWSFSYPGANFFSASVTMRDGQGGTIPVSLEPVSNGYGENTLVWQVSNPVPGGLTGDTPIDVTISNVGLGEQTTSFTYRVTIFDPATAGPSQPPGGAAPGVYRSGSWFLDDGDGLWEGCATDVCAGFGAAGFEPLSADFNGDNSDQIGVFRDGWWYIDNGNFQWDGCGVDTCAGYGVPGDQAVYGDFDGDGQAQIGLFRDGFWFLDNGNYKWDGCGVETCIGVGQAGDTPIVDDFNGDGKDQVGVFRAGAWYIDDGDGVWEGCGVDLCAGYGGPLATPVPADYSGDGRAQLAVFDNGFWVIDDGDAVWEGCGVETCIGFGGPTSTPVPDDYSGNGRAQIAVFDNGFWAIDDGDAAWEGCGVDACLGLGQSGDQPTPGRW